MGRSGEVESQEDVLMDEAPSNISQASTLQANREGIFISFISIGGKKLLTFRLLIPACH